MNAETGRMLAADPRVADPAHMRRWQPSRRTLRARFYLYLVLLDIVCIMASFLLVGAVYWAADYRNAQVIAYTILPLYLVAAFSIGAYSIDAIGQVRAGIGRSLRSFAFAAGAVLFVAFYLRSSEEFSRVLFGFGSMISLFTLTAGRWAFLRRAREIVGGNPYNVVMLSDGEHLAPAGEFSAVLATSSFRPDTHDPVMYDRLAVALRQADRVVVHCRPDERGAWVHALQGANVQAEIVAAELNEITPLGLGRFGGQPTIVVAKGPLGIQDRVIKRLFDIAVAGTLLVVLSPVLALVALAIRLETSGPVLFVQTRIGRGNRMFRMLKFRSMRAEASDGQGDASTRRDDDRITRVGGFLRRTSIDELPQLLNVLTGTMSVVGPRPHALGSRAEDKLFWEIDGRYWHRHAAKPGLTGLAQVRGYRGATNQQIDLTNRLQSDLEYLDGWTIWRDVLIVLQTFRVVVHKNAF